VSAPLKLAAFALALAAVFGIATFAGATAGPDRSGESSTGMTTEDGAEEHGMGTEATKADPVRGLAVADDGLKLVLDRPAFDQGRAAELRFSIRGADGEPVREYDVVHEKRMHLIVVRRDGSGFQHLHPELSSDGVWSVPLALPEPGSYRVFADFSHDGEAETLAADLAVDGEADYRALPAPTTSADTGDGYQVELDAADARAGSEAVLGFTVTRDGESVKPEPYLGARGHLVALREGDLAYLHVHADEDSLAFMAEFPTERRYRLYLQFKHEGRVHTAAFTQDVLR
jgi:hypothetical protein